MTHAYSANGLFRADVVIDENPTNPRETMWDNLAQFHFWPMVEKLCLKNDPIPANATREDSITAVTFPIFLLNHSGYSLSTHDFNDPWDSRRVGTVFVFRKMAREWFGWKRITKARVQHIEAQVNRELTELERYLNGEVYAIKIKKILHRENRLEDVATISGFYFKSEAERLLPDVLADVQSGNYFF